MRIQSVSILEVETGRKQDGDIQIRFYVYPIRFPSLITGRGSQDGQVSCTLCCLGQSQIVHMTICESVYIDTFPKNFGRIYVV